MFWIGLMCAAAFVSFVVNGVQALSTLRYASPFRWAWFTLYAFISGLSAFYVGALLWFLVGNPDRAAWSETLTPVGVMSFLLVWSLPAVLSLVEERARHEP